MFNDKSDTALIPKYKDYVGRKNRYFHPFMVCKKRMEIEYTSKRCFFI